MRLKELTILTENIDGQKVFYRQILGLPFTMTHANYFEVCIGASKLFFHASQTSNPYHIAINIPSFQEKEAVVWLKERVKLLSFKGQELVNFKSWNAKSIYFYDEDKNILEFIARKDLNIKAEDQFSVQNLVEISELGLAVDNILPIHDFLKRNYKLSIYAGDMDQFCAMGNGHFLFIIINRDHKRWIPRNDVALIAPFEARLELDSGHETALQFNDDGMLKLIQ